MTRKHKELLEFAKNRYPSGSFIIDILNPKGHLSGIIIWEGLHEYSSNLNWYGDDYLVKSDNQIYVSTIGKQYRVCIYDGTKWAEIDHEKSDKAIVTTYEWERMREDVLKD